MGGGGGGGWIRNLRLILNGREGGEGERAISGIPTVGGKYPFWATFRVGVGRF